MGRAQRIMRKKPGVLMSFWLSPWHILWLCHTIPCHTFPVTFFRVLPPTFVKQWHAGSWDVLESRCIGWTKTSDPAPNSLVWRIGFRRSWVSPGAQMQMQMVCFCFCWTWWDYYGYDSCMYHKPLEPHGYCIWIDIVVWCCMYMHVSYTIVIGVHQL